MSDTAPTPVTENAYPNDGLTEGPDVALNAKNASALAIRTEGLTKVVDSPGGSLTILSGVNLTVHEGESIAIVGASGSGKSTLLGLLAGLDAPSGGTVQVAGQDLGELDEDGRAALRGKHVGFVFQSFQLIGSLTALENVMLPLELAGNPRARERAIATLERVGLNERAAHYPNQLSGGEQQRVAIARAFSTEPDILFADEPTGNLDKKTGDRIAELLFALNREHGTTLVLVTHDMALARACGRQVELLGGVTVEQHKEPPLPSVQSAHPATASASVSGE